MAKRYRIQTLGPNGAVTYESMADSPYSGLSGASLSPWRDGVREGTADAYVSGADGKLHTVGRIRVRVIDTMTKGSRP
jgi:hypothetical protein